MPSAAPSAEKPAVAAPLISTATATTTTKATTTIPATATTTTALPSKKRKASHDAAATTTTSERPRAESEAASSEDTTTMAFGAIMDGSVTSKASTSIPHKKRKTSFENAAAHIAASTPLQEESIRKSSFELFNIAAGGVENGSTRKSSFELFNMAAGAELDGSGERKGSFELFTAATAPDSSDSRLRKASFELFSVPSATPDSTGVARSRKLSFELLPAPADNAIISSPPAAASTAATEVPSTAQRKGSFELFNVPEPVESSAASAVASLRKGSFELFNVPAPVDSNNTAATNTESRSRKASFELFDIPAPAPVESSTTGPRSRKASFDLFNEAVAIRGNSFDAASTVSHTNASEGPLRKRKLSTASAMTNDRPRLMSIGSIDDAALGLVPLGSASGSHASDEQQQKNSMSFGGPTSSSLAALDHLDALGDESASINGTGGSGSKLKMHMMKGIPDDDASQESTSSNTMASGNQRLLLEALMMGSHSTSRRRDRFESWGGMSDISLTMGSGLSAIDPNPLMEGAAAAAALAASAMQSALPDGDCGLSDASDSEKPVPSKISLTRDRKYSMASLGDASVTGGGEMSQDIQAFVAAAMATVGDQLAELAGVVETVAGSAASISSDMLREMVRDDNSSVISTASSLPDIQAQLQMQLSEGRPRSLSTSSNPIAVDYDAVAAAVNAAEAATGALDLSHFGGVKDESSDSLLPPIPPIPPLPSSGKSERDMDAIRARARAAAGYVPPANLKPGEIPPPQPTKKRSKPSTQLKNAGAAARNRHVFVPDHSYSMYHAANKASSQKWDEMYDCLLDFVEERRKGETKNMTDKDRKDWDWDGNVPTTYKTDDGKALGRWINNQRSAKHKGSLKKDREVKLMSTGLKWSVLSTNSWQDMMEELKIYVSDKTKEGQDWDGNVPTNYKIKGSTDEDGEEKNLGRWINRQRSLYQSGKLRKDREAELEAIGLKWSVLSTTSWQSMYETLLDYVNGRKSIDGNWDGNVPANFKTSDQPPKALGRWINRQRTAHQKHKLKAEFVEKLNSIGLKWSVHERRPPLPFAQQETPIKNNLTAVRPSGIVSSGGVRATPAKSGTSSTAATPVIKNGRSSASLVAAAAAATPIMKNGSSAALVAAAAARKAAAEAKKPDVAKSNAGAKDGKPPPAAAAAAKPPAKAAAEPRPEAVTSA